MSNFTINFSYAWLLLLLIPVLFLALFPHFRVAKKYRRTRNRITSLVLHCVIMVLAVLVLSGITFEYDVPNDENEILLLVDSSYSTETAGANIDRFVKDVIDYSDSRYKVGVVTFGFDQVYAAPFSYDGDEVYRQYRDSNLPDTSATDIESALTYARTLLKYPETSKIVIISDGIETDGKAMSAIRKVAADGVHVDTKYLHGEVFDDVEIVDVSLPEKTIVVDDPITVTLTVQSSHESAINITMFDNGEGVANKSFTLNRGANTLTLQHAFERLGMHVLTFQMEAEGDYLNENNVFTSYIYLDTFDKLLILESNAGESDKFKEILTEAGYQVDVVDSHDAAAVPSTLAELCAYDQVIMMNVANADMPEGFDAILNSYVYTIGGGMFTVGGNKIDEDGTVTANMYNRDDMINTLYQRMLPVQAIDYTPPLGLQIVIDRSGSMNGNDASGINRLDAARDSAFNCLDVLNDRDWCGIISFETDFKVELEMTRVTQRTVFLDALNNITSTGGTNYAGPIEAAGLGLKQLRDVEKKHILFITDGQPGESADKYMPFVQSNYEAGITISVVGIGITENSAAATKMQEIADEGGGKFYRVTDLNELRNILRDDLTMDTIRQYIPKDFTPKVVAHSSAATIGLPDDLPMLGGYYGTRLKSDATQVVLAEYVPLYAEWTYGAGNVGSFMCDLKGADDSWSQGFMADPMGVKFLLQVVNSLFPTKSVRPTDIMLELREQNYRNQMSIFTTLESDQSIDVTIYKVSDDGENEEVYQTFTAGATEDYSRVNILTTEAGVYRILVEKKNASDVISYASIYKTFSYSAEYDVFVDYEAGRKSLEMLATLGKGDSIEVASEVFLEFVDKIHRVVDPRLAMIIIALILFLIDIAVRKFKFKWPHELIREFRNRKDS
ncbi:MAG: VWA domain-containing protein [Clostridiales bacterium]|nr:VWA domain-containing protein [Clostridiales bacterium]